MKPNYPVLSKLNPELKEKLPETYRLLMTAGIRVHPRVRKITLHGSRGPKGGYRPDSDIDLCLVTDIDIQITPEEQAKAQLQMVLQAALSGGNSPAELDLAAVFDHMGCGLCCFSIHDFTQLHCPRRQTGCPGLFKIQKNYHGFVPPVTEVKEMYPFMTIWER